MALVDLSTVNVYPYAKRITLGTAGTVQAVKLPGDCTRFTLQFITNAGKYSHTGTDGSAIGSEYSTIAANSPKVYDRGRMAQDQIVYVAGAVDSTVIEVELERAV